MDIELKPGESLRGVTVQGPGGGRAKFRVIVKYDSLEQQNVQKQVKDARIDTINHNYKKGLLSMEAAALQFERLKEDFRRELGAPKRSLLRQKYDSAHAKVFEDYWEFYQQNLTSALKNETSTITDIKRALRAVKDLNLYSSTPAEFRAVIRLIPPRKRVRIIDRLNSVLDFLGRDFSIPREFHRDTGEIAYLTWDELQRVISHFREEYGRKYKFPKELFQIIAETLFSTGVRWGELFEMKRSKLDRTRSFIQINAQWAARYDQVTKSIQIEKGASRKNARSRPSYLSLILEEGKASLMKWISYLEETEVEVLDHLCASDIFYDAISTAAIAAFPRTPTKQITIHNLRNSYAIYLLESGFNIGQAATYIGDTDRVVREHYAKWEITDRMKQRDLELIQQAAQKNKESTMKNRALKTH